MRTRGLVRRWAGLAALALLTACSDGDVVVGAGSAGPVTDPVGADPAEFGPLPEFHLVSEHGAEVTRESLLGRPVVIAALFSTCSGPCPSIARSLKSLQDSLRDTDVLLVAVSVDPEHDTPEVLARYAERQGADPARWIFLTGAEAEVYTLVQRGFFLAVERGAADSPEGQRVTHDTRLLALDRAGRRRGWYVGTDAAAVQKLKARMRALAAEPRR
jgi:cytochrome oxidase Cu insertion factor (SCO1/SenC/PrrC family)